MIHDPLLISEDWAHDPLLLYLQDKQRKVADELSKFMMEKQKQLIMVKDLKKLNKDLYLYRETNKLLVHCTEKKEAYQKFLEIVVKMTNDKFTEVQSFMNRILVLDEIRWHAKVYLLNALSLKKYLTMISTFIYSSTLKKRLQNATDIRTKYTKDLETFSDQIQKSTMNCLGNNLDLLVFFTSLDF